MLERNTQGFKSAEHDISEVWCHYQRAWVSNSSCRHPVLSIE